MTPEALTETLTQPWAHGTHVDARGIALHSLLELNDETVCNFDLSNAKIEGGLRAQRAEFKGMAWLRGAEVSGTCDFSGATFRSDLRLDGLVCDRLILNAVCCEGVLSLDGAQIGSLTLTDALCLANLSLAGTIVKARADLSGSQIMGGIWAEGAEIGHTFLTDLDVEGRRRGV